MEWVLALGLMLYGMKGILQFLVFVGAKRVLVLIVILFAFYVLGPAAAVLALL